MSYTYTYTKSTLPNIDKIHEDVSRSSITNKNIQYCNWNDETQNLEVIWDIELSTGDKTLLDTIVSNCGSPIFYGLNEVIQCRNTVSVDLNVVTPVAIPWGSEDNKDDLFTHSNTTNNSRITINKTGTYIFCYQINSTNTTNNRKNVRCRVRLNGVTYLDQGVSNSLSYNRTDSKHSNSAHFQYAFINSGDYIEIMADRVGGSTGAVDLDVGTSTITIKVLRF